MTLSVATQRVDVPGNGSATTFSFSPIVIQQAAHLTVVMRDTLGNQTVLVPGSLGNNYTLNVTSFPGTGSITYPATGSTGGTTLPAGWTLTLEREVPLTQVTSLPNQSAFFGTTVEATFDYVTMAVQQLQEQLSRALLAAQTDPQIPLTLPTSIQRASQLLGFDSSGNPIAAQPSSALVSSPMQPIVDAASTALAVNLLGLRIPCTANTTFFVDNVNGTDNVAHGLSSGTGAFRSIQFAINTVHGLYDGRGFTGTISVAGTGGQTYSETITVDGPFVNFFSMTLSCNATLNSVIISSPVNPIAVRYGAELYITGGFWFSCSTVGQAITASFGGRVFLSGITFGASGGIGLYATRFGYIEILADIHVQASVTFANLWQASHHGNIRHSSGAIVQFDGPTNCTDCFLYCDYGDITITASAGFNLNGHSMVGCAYRAAENGLIQWVDGSNGTAVSIPGSVGVCVTGGQYAYGSNFQGGVAGGSFTVNMATIGTGSITLGIGFVPGDIDWLASVSGGATTMMASAGFTTLTCNATANVINTNGCVAGGIEGAQPSTTTCLAYNTSGSAGVSAAVTSVTADGNGFVLTFATNGSPTGTLTILWKARRGM